MKLINLLSLFAVSVLSAQALATTDFGIAGRDGRSGQDGRDGRSGFSASIRASGQLENLHLDGEDAIDGRDGEAGENASSCVQSTPADNVLGAMGGAGGNAGKAGNGGDGGDLTVYTTSDSTLSAVFVSSRPGHGARSGRPGIGGKGCDCSTPSWLAQQCHNETNPDGTSHSVCGNVTFTCSNGGFGKDGAQAQEYGNPGKLGHLTVIHQMQDPVADQPNLTAPFPNFFTLGQVMLTKNIWQQRKGALALLAPGSVISDDYRSFDSQKQLGFDFVWGVNRPIADFKSISMTVAMNDSATGIDLSLPDNIWFHYHRELIGSVYKFSFEQMFFDSEVVQLKAQLTGTNNGNLVATVSDATDLSSVVTTSFVGKLEIPGFLWGTVLFEGPVPAELINRDGKNFTIQVSKLPGLDSSKIQSGTKLVLSLDATRSLDSFSTDQELRARITLP